MKLLIFSDVHGDSRAARSLVERSRSVDVVIGAGDFCNVRRGLEEGVAPFRAIDKPCVFVAGNNETLDELREVCRDLPRVHVLHGSKVEIDGVEFFGLGGAVPITPFGAWSYDLSEDEAQTLLKDCPRGCVLISHSPPKGAVDMASSGQSLGSTAVREAILRVQPRLVVCGHIHACAGQRADIGQTPVINAGPGGIEWELEVSG